MEHPAKSLVERSTVTMRIDPEEGRSDAETALRLLQRQPDPDLEIRARLVLCDYYAERDQGAARQHVELASALLPKTMRAGLRAGVLTCHGEMLETAGNNTQARAMYDRAVTVAAEAKDDEMLASALFSRGYLLGLQGEYAAGLSDLRRAQTLFERIDLQLHALTALNSIAILYNRMGDYAQARHIYTRALKAQREAGMQREEAVTLHNLGRALEHLREWDGAREAFTSSLTISRALGYTRGEAYALRGLAAVANASGDASGALRTLERASALQQQTPDARLRAQIQLARGIALHAERRLPEAIEALEDAVLVFRDADALGDLGTAYSELAAVHARMGNWRAAYGWRGEAQEMSERLLRNQLDQRFATLKVEFDTATKEKENELLMRENESTQNALAQARRVRQLQGAVIALTVLLAILLATLALHQRRSTVRMRELAMTDELTGIPNRRAVLRRLEPLLAASGGEHCSVLIIDIDHFKSINDHLGHPVGDQVLQFVAQKLCTAVQEPAFFGRLGGEEFLVVLPGTMIENAFRTAESLRELIMSIDTTRWFPDRRRITASVGITSSVSFDNVSSVLQRADAALYAAKRAGRNCVRTEPATTQDASAWILGAQIR